MCEHVPLPCSRGVFSDYRLNIILTIPKMSLVAMQVWEDDINAKGGLLGRPVKLIYYDDQSNPSQVPAIYSKLLDVDKVDLIVSGYASTQIAAAMPVAIQRKKLFVSLFGTGSTRSSIIQNIFR